MHSRRHGIVNAIASEDRTSLGPLGYGDHEQHAGRLTMRSWKRFGLVSFVIAIIVMAGGYAPGSITPRNSRPRLCCKFLRRCPMSSSRLARPESGLIISGISLPR